MLEELLMHWLRSLSIWLILSRDGVYMGSAVLTLHCNHFWFVSKFGSLVESFVGQSGAGKLKRRKCFWWEFKEMFLIWTLFALTSVISVCDPFLSDFQVQAALKRQWMQYKTQWGQRRKDHCSMRSTSYTATSITEVPAFVFHQDSNNEHLNGRHTEDSELVALKSGDAYA